MLSLMMLQDGGFCPMCGMMAGWGWLGMLLMALFWIAVIGGLVWLVARLLGSRNGGR